MPDKEIRVALWSCRDANGKRRIARFGEVVDLPESEIVRGEQAGVFDQPLADPVVVVDDEADEETLIPLADDAANVAPPADLHDISTGPKGPVPPKTGLKELWVEYAVENGMTESDAEAMSKHELIAKFGTGSD